MAEPGAYAPPVPSRQQEGQRELVANPTIDPRPAGPETRPVEPSTLLQGEHAIDRIRIPGAPSRVKASVRDRSSDRSCVLLSTLSGAHRPARGPSIARHGAIPCAEADPSGGRQRVVPDGDRSWLQLHEEVSPPEFQTKVKPAPTEVMVVNDAPGEECRSRDPSRTTTSRSSTPNANRQTATKVGNIYKGRVANVEPAIQAAFIDYGEGTERLPAHLRSAPQVLLVWPGPDRNAWG